MRCSCLLSAFVFILAPAPAAACGGLFCDGAGPTGNPSVVQSAERIIFARGNDGAVTAIIQILYEGPADEFAWLLPIEGEPEIDVSSDAAFVALQRATNPSYTLTFQTEGQCRPPSFGGGCALGASPSFDDGGEFWMDPGVPQIEVLSSGTVGPYDFVILGVEDMVEDPVEEARVWLTENGYDVSELGVERLRSYLEAGLNLLAFRLTKDADDGSIRPVRLRFGSGLPSIPIRPTAAAAGDDMGVMVWVLGDARAIPANYASLELNEAAINWLDPGPTYDAIVTQAANEVGGQGFVTEMAGEARPLAEEVWSRANRDRFAELEALDWSGNGRMAFDTFVTAFRDFDGMRDAIAGLVIVPEGSTLDSVVRQPSIYELEPGFDPASFIAAVRELVIDPMAETADLFQEHPWVTRLYTTMSADEMTLDPVFDFNADLPRVDNAHVADRWTECWAGTLQTSAPWRVELPSGDIVRARSFVRWPFRPTDEDPIPAVRVARRVGTSGVGEVVLDNRDVIAARLAAQSDGVPSRSGAVSVESSVLPGAAAGAVVHTAQQPAVLVLGLAAIALSLRRRRR